MVKVKPFFKWFCRSRDDQNERQKTFFPLKKYKRKRKKHMNNVIFVENV